MSEGSIEYDAILDLCRDRHRRIVLAVLASQRRAVTVNDLSSAIVRHNHQAAITEVSGDLVGRVERSLHHVHVPRLVDVGVVEYDAERRLVEPTDRFDRLEPQLSTIVDADPDLEQPLEL